MDKLGPVCAGRIAEIATSQKNIWVLDGDSADSTGADVFAYRHQERFLNAGIAEQAMVSVAAGMAACGLRPWVFSFAAFLCYRAYDQIRVCVSQTKLPVVLVGSHAGGLSGRNGKTHTALNDIALMASLPGISVWTPADKQDAVFCIDHLNATPMSSYIRLPRETVSLIGGESSKVRWIGRPHRLAIISAGLSSHWAIEAAGLLRGRGIDIGVFHFCQVWPVADCIKDLLASVDMAFVLEDHYGMGGLTSILQSLDLPPKIVSLAWPSDWSGQSGAPTVVLKNFHMDASSVAQRIANFLQANDSLAMRGSDKRHMVA